MSLTIIVAFGYTDSSTSTHLPSSIVDAYRVSTFNNLSHQYIITDQTPLLSTKKPCKLDGDWNSFVTNSRTNNIKWLNVKSLNDLTVKSSQIPISNYSKIVIYYSGHGNQDSTLEFPNGDTIEHCAFRDLFLSRVSKDSETLMIIDCCSAGNFDLPFSLVDRRFQFSKVNKYTCKKVICITSNQLEQESKASSKYSYFTKYLFRVLSEKHTRLDKIVSLIEEKLLIRTSQRVGVYSSYNIIPMIYQWIHLKPTICFTSLVHSIVIKRTQSRRNIENYEF